MTVSPTARLERLTAALADIDEFVALRLPRLDAPGVAVGLTDRERTLGFVCRGFADVASGKQTGPHKSHMVRNIVLISVIAVAVVATVIGIEYARCGPLGCGPIKI